MRCPGCNFVCSEFRDICHRCLADLRPHKRLSGLRIQYPDVPYKELIVQLGLRHAPKTTTAENPISDLIGKLKASISALIAAPASSPPPIQDRIPVSSSTPIEATPVPSHDEPLLAEEDDLFVDEVRGSTKIAFDDDHLELKELEAPERPLMSADALESLSALSDEFTEAPSIPSLISAQTDLVQEDLSATPASPHDEPKPDDVEETQTVVEPPIIGLSFEIADHFACAPAADQTWEAPVAQVAENPAFEFEPIAPQSPDQNECAVLLTEFSFPSLQSPIGPCFVWRPVSTLTIDLCDEQEGIAKPEPARPFHDKLTIDDQQPIALNSSEADRTAPAFPLPNAPVVVPPRKEFSEIEGCEILQAFAELQTSISQAEPPENLFLSDAVTLSATASERIVLLYDLLRESIQLGEARPQYVEHVQTSEDRVVENYDLQSQLAAVEKRIDEAAGPQKLGRIGTQVNDDSTAAADLVAYAPAPLAKRILGFWFDVGLCAAVAGGVAWFFEPDRGRNQLLAFIEHPAWDPSHLPPIVLIAVVLWIMIYPLMQAVFLTLWGTTPGLILNGCRIRTSAGKPITTTHALARSFIQPFSLIFGGGLIGLGITRRTLHDRISATQVVHGCR